MSLLGSILGWVLLIWLAVIFIGRFLEVRVESLKGHLKHLRHKDGS